MCVCVCVYFNLVMVWCLFVVLFCFVSLIVGNFSVVLDFCLLLRKNLKFSVWYFQKAFGQGEERDQNILKCKNF